MKIVVAMESFKDSLTAAADAIRSAVSEAAIVTMPSVGSYGWPTAASRLWK